VRRRAFAREPIARRSGLSPGAFDRDFVRLGRPVLLEGLVRDWTRLGWDVSVWAERWPSRQITVEEVSSGDPYDIFSQFLHQLTLADLVRRYERDTPATYPSLACDPRLELPEILEETKVPEVLGARRVEWTLFGGRDPIVLVHYHSAVHVLLCQVRSPKRVLLFCPEDGRYLYPHGVDTEHYSKSRVDPAAPDLARFPEFRRARPLDVFLEPGDALFIPVHWWHWTAASGPAISAAVSWRARFFDYSFPNPYVRNLIAKRLRKARES